MMKKLLQNPDVLSVMVDKMEEMGIVKEGF